MKANTILRILMLLAATVFSSCSSVNYRMETRIAKNGSVERTVYASADSAFLAGDRSHNPFLFEIGQEWKIISLDSTETTPFLDENINVNVKIVSGERHVNAYSARIRGDETTLPLAAPQESLQRKFKWFHTYYIFEAVYKNIADKIPVPVSRYFDDAKQKLWFQGDFSAYSGMTGFEMKNVFDDAEEIFFVWYNANLYEKSLETVRSFTDNQHTSLLAEIKDRLFAETIKNKNITEIEFDPEYLCEILDSHLGIDYFSTLYAAKKSEIEKKFEENTRQFKIFENGIKYDLWLPGNIVSANTSTREGGFLTWKVNALRFVSEDYVLTAQSRVTNIWAFVVTAALVLLSIICLAKAFGKRY